MTSEEDFKREVDEKASQFGIPPDVTGEILLFVSQLILSADANQIQFFAWCLERAAGEMEKEEQA